MDDWIAHSMTKECVGLKLLKYEFVCFVIMLLLVCYQFSELIELTWLLIMGWTVENKE